MNGIEKIIAGYQKAADGLQEAIEALRESRFELHANEAWEAYQKINQHLHQYSAVLKKRQGTPYAHR